MNSAAKYNAPRWYPSWTDQKTGKLCKGFWYVWDGQKKHNLSKLGAIRENVKPGSKAYMAGVAPAYQAWCDEQEQAEQVAEAEKVAKSGPVLVVDVANAYLNSIKGKKSYANIEIYLGKFLAFEKYGRLWDWVGSLGKQLAGFRLQCLYHG